MSSPTPVLGRLPGRDVVHVLRHIGGVYIPDCINYFAAKRVAVVDENATDATCARCAPTKGTRP